ncbi:hypothetical protein INT47_004247 [Mucor saturninus]|uniref:CTLH domain-containing protein n=1 Tax=Mucor saturninus TaxID=64648 RepID=A0A8H7RAQ4_9FUNG|nr:hypothetical protein INT47_004247 [Mucor saturninus]
MDSECRSIVIEYLMHNCFKKTAKALLTETTRLENEDLLDTEKQWLLLDARKNLTDAIEKGDIPLAFDLINQHFPVLAAQDILQPHDTPEATKLHMILFKLKCQRFIEIIKTSSELEAIRYAQLHLKPANNPWKESQVKEVTALIAYVDPYQSQSKHLLTQERRQQLAKEVNHVLLAQSQLPIQTSIEKLSRQYALVQEELEQSVINSPTILTQREKMAI